MSRRMCALNFYIKCMHQEKIFPFKLPYKFMKSDKANETATAKLIRAVNKIYDITN